MEVTNHLLTGMILQVWFLQWNLWHPEARVIDEGLLNFVDAGLEIFKVATAKNLPYRLGCPPSQ